MRHNVLATALKTNAGFSVTTGVISLVAAPAIAEWMGLARWLLIATGAGLVGFGLVVAAVAREPKPKSVRPILLADATWVIGAGALLLVAPDLLTLGGRWALAAVSVIVADIAIAQWVGLRQAASPRRR